MVIGVAPSNQSDPPQVVMRFPCPKGTVLFSLGVLASAAFGGAADAGKPSSKPAASAGRVQQATSQALLAAAGRGVVVPPGLSDVEHMCAMLIGCGDIPIQIPTYDFGLCVRHFWDRLSGPDAISSSLTIRECGLGAVSCGQFARCALRGADPSGCDGRGVGSSKPVGRCDLSGRALHCLEGKVVGVRDCPRGGELCAVRAGEADCVAGRCTADGGKKSKPACSSDGSRITSCKNGRTVSMSCAALGLRCDTVDGKPTCVPGSARKCSGTGERCDHAAAVKCVHGREVRVQCNQANLVCGVGVEDRTQVGACATSPYSGSDDECDPEKFRSRCSGNAVQYCVGGQLRKYDCKTYFGMNKCVGQPGQAHCVR